MTFQYINVNLTNNVKVRTLWARRQDMKKNVFLWLVIHRALRARQWLQQSRGPTACIYCSCQTETLKHCLWECHVAQQVWRRVFRILTFMCRDGSFSWGTVVWATITQMMWPYEACLNDMVIRIQRGRVRVVRSHMKIRYMLKARQEVWELLCTTTMWFIWTPWCSKVFDNIIVHPVESVQNI